MEERRKSARKSLISYSQVFDRNGGVLLGFLSDLTPAGAMVIGQKAVEVGRQTILQIEVPELPGITLRQLTIPARVIWCHTDISPEFQNIGFQFGDIQPEQAKVIQAIIRGYEFRRDVPPYSPHAAPEP